MPCSCPDCGTEMQSCSPAGPRTLACPSCRGHLYGLAPFERRLGEGVGASVWVASATGTPAGPCPYCGVPMHSPDGTDAAAAGVTVCRVCQQVWVPDRAAAWLTAHTASPATAADPDGPAPTPSECHNCGAPYSPDEEGRCSYCRAQIAAPQPLLVVIDAPAPPQAGFRLF